MWTWKHFWWKPWVRDLTPTWGKSSHPGIPIYLGAMHECQFVMGWSLKMRHACDFMVIERIGSLMNMSYGNLISWRHDMALFCFRHGQLQMREGLQSPWGQSAQSDEWMNSRTWSRRRHEFRLGGLVQCWPSVTLVKNCYSVSKYFFEIAGSQLENEKSEHVPQHVTCEIHQQFNQLMPCKCVTWEFANDMFNMLMNCHVSIGMWPWHVQHADDMPSCFAWEFDHDMSNMLMPHGSSTMTCPTCWWHMGVWPWHVQHAHDLQHAPHMGLWYHMLTFV